MREIIKQHEPLRDGQTVLEVKVIRRTKLQKSRVVSAPKPISRSLSAMFGGDVPGIVDDTMEKQVGTEYERFRWMKPDGNGGLIPR